MSPQTWATGIDAHEYVEWLNRLFEGITEFHEEPKATDSNGGSPTDDDGDTLWSGAIWRGMENVEILFDILGDGEGGSIEDKWNRLGDRKNRWRAAVDVQRAVRGMLGRGEARHRNGAAHMIGKMARGRHSRKALDSLLRGTSNDNSLCSSPLYFDDGHFTSMARFGDDDDGDGDDGTAGDGSGNGRTRDGLYTSGPSSPGKRGIKQRWALRTKDDLLSVEEPPPGLTSLPTRPFHPPDPFDMMLPLVGRTPTKGKAFEAKSKAFPPTFDPGAKGFPPTTAERLFTLRRPSSTAGLDTAAVFRMTRSTSWASWQDVLSSSSSITPPRPLRKIATTPPASEPTLMLLKQLPSPLKLLPRPRSSAGLRTMASDQRLTTSPLLSTTKQFIPVARPSSAGALRASVDRMTSPSVDTLRVLAKEKLVDERKSVTRGAGGGSAGTRPAGSWRGVDKQARFPSDVLGAPKRSSPKLVGFGRVKQT